MSSRPKRGLADLLPTSSGAGQSRVLYVFGVLAAAKALALVVIADSLARGIVAVINGGPGVESAIWWGVGAAVLRAAASWATHVFAARSAIGVKEDTRQRLADRILAGGDSGDGAGHDGAVPVRAVPVGAAPLGAAHVGAVHVGSATALATRGLDELDKYYLTVLPAAMNAAVIPLAIGARILFADWFSAVIIVVTVPLIPVFMILIGSHTANKVAAATDALARLSDHLVELARGLPVLVGLGRVEEQSAALERISVDYKSRALRTLRIAFLSALALELISTISVAVVAVFIGFRLVDGSLSLQVGLLVLILAPECFAPFREVGSAFHASQDGVLALRRARELIDSPQGEPLREPSSAAARVTVSRLTVRYSGRSETAVASVSFELEPDAITAITGPSGSGKSTVLAALAGRLSHRADDTIVTGTVTGIAEGSVAWVPQHPHTVGSTVRDELVIYAGTLEPAFASLKINGYLDEFGLAWAADEDPAQLSPGELRRLAIARALLRCDNGATLLLLDEPTAHLDAGNAAVVENAIARLVGSVTIVVASHEASVVGLAAHRIDLAPTSAHGREQPPAESPFEVDSDDTPAREDDAAEPPQDDHVAGARMLGSLIELVRPARGRFLLAIVLGVLAALFAIALTAVSGWLIVRASQHPAIMYLMVAIVGVRFFGIGRAALRYAERLVTHDAIFEAVTGLRMRLWRALAARGAASRSMLRGGTALDFLVGTADHIRDLVPRVLVPPIVGTLTALSAIVAIALLHAPAVPLLAVSCLLSIVVAPAIALRADRAASSSRASIRSAVIRGFAAMVGAAAELRANGVDGEVRARVRELDRRSGELGRASAWALGFGGAIVVAANSVTAVLMLLVSAPAVAAGTLPGEVVAVLVLLPLALIDPLLAVVDAVQQWPTLASALRKIAELGPVSEPLIGGQSLDDELKSVELRDLSARWPESSTPAFENVTARVGTGDWLVVTGRSGSGKSTLLTVLLGYLPSASGHYLVNFRDSRTIDPVSLRRHVAWCPQESHLFDSTLRANLLLARPHGDAPDDAELRSALDRAGLRGFVDRLPNGFDTRIGSEGAQLSGGERQRVAVARTLLTRAEVVLLDEPTAHLDRETATELMADLRVALRQQITVLVTHHVEDERPSDTVLTLGAARPSPLPAR